jgi:hypothetical protein
MPFEDSDHREPGGNWDEFAHMSPKLMALAEQLSDDAKMLQERYPAKAFDFAGLQAADDSMLAICIGDGDHRQPRRIGRLLKSTAIRWSIIAGSGAAAVLSAVMIWQAAGIHRDGESEADSQAIVVMAPEELFHMNDTTGRVGHSGAQEPRSAVDILRGLSAAEQEAFLDLLEDNHGSKESVSI